MIEKRNKKRAWVNCYIGTLRVFLKKLCENLMFKCKKRKILQHPQSATDSC